MPGQPELVRGQAGDHVAIAVAVDVVGVHLRAARAGERRLVQLPRAAAERLGLLEPAVLHDDVDAAVKRATAAGGTVLISPFDVGKIARMAVIADPEGVPVGLAHPL